MLGRAWAPSGQGIRPLLKSMPPPCTLRREPEGTHSGGYLCWLLLHSVSNADDTQVAFHHDEWSAVELFILKFIQRLRNKRALVFTGSWFDPALEEIQEDSHEDDESNKRRVPDAYWKAAVGLNEESGVIVRTNSTRRLGSVLTSIFRSMFAFGCLTTMKRSPHSTTCSRQSFRNSKFRWPHLKKDLESRSLSCKQRTLRR